MVLLVGHKYWIPDEEHVYLPAECLTPEGKFKTEFGERTVTPGDFPAVDDQQLRGEPDVAGLSNAGQESMLHTVRVRYLRDDIYTNVGRILIAVNPFQKLPITGQKYLDMYQSEGGDAVLPPHIYGIGRDAFQGLINGNGSQAVLVAGESGAGKTESAKLVFNYVASCGGSGGVETRVIQVNPMLEAFGNAKTVRNDNSSRFGKWTELAIDSSGSVQSARIVDYLLETTRVLSLNPGERNYHIFYQILKADPDKYGLSSKIEDYKFLAGSAPCPSVDDVEEHRDLRQAAKDMGMSQEEVDHMLSIVAGVLVLGNVNVTEDDGDGEGSKIANFDVLKKTCELWGGIDAADVAEKITKKELKIGGEITKKLLTPAQAEASKGTLAKLVYLKCFQWLVKRLNTALQEGMPFDTSSDFFGVLDIAGFEVFETNSLEQLFINLSNEMLQQHFNFFVFKDELKIYEQEGVALTDFEFSDNQEILDMIQAPKVGIFAHMNDELRVPKSNDKTLLNRLLKNFDSNPCFGKGKPNVDYFIVKHYAGPVQYTIGGFMEKNRDTVPDLVFLKSSDNVVISQLEQTADPKKPTVATSFKNSLAELMEKLRSAHPHFVRCIKPNPEKMKQKFVAVQTAEQLKYAGVFEAIQIRQRGYPVRWTFQEFINKYVAIFPSKTRSDLRAAPSGMKIMEALNVLCDDSQGTWKGQYVTGTNKIMFKSSMQSVLDGFLSVAYGPPCLQIQKVWRGYIARRKVNTLRVIRTKIEQFEETNAIAEGATFYGTNSEDVGKLQELIRAAVLIQEEIDAVDFQHPSVKAFAQFQHKISAEVDTVHTLTEVIHSGSRLDLEAAAARAKDLGFAGFDIVKQVEQSAVTMELEEMKSPGVSPESMLAVLEKARDLEVDSDVVREVGKACRAKMEEAGMDVENTEVLQYILAAEIEAEKKAEEERIAAEKRAEEERILAEKKAEEERIAAEKLAEEERIAAEKKADEERIAAEKKAEEERIAAERKAEEEMIAAEKLAEQERMAAEKRAEEERISAEQKAEEERIMAQEKAEEKRIMAEKEERLAEERRRLAEESKAEEERLAEERRIEEERLAEERRIEEERLAEERKEDEERMARALEEEAAQMAAREEEEKRAEEKRIADLQQEQIMNEKNKLVLPEEMIAAAFAAGEPELGEWEKHLKMYMTVYDFEMLKECLEEESGDHSERRDRMMKEAHKLFLHLHEETYVLMIHDRASAESSFSHETILRLRNLAKIAEMLGMSEVQAKASKAVTRRMSHRRNSNLSNEALSEMVDDIYPLMQCPVLHPVTIRQGLCHSRVPIRAPLTRLEDPALSKLAIQNYHNVMTYMKDKPSFKVVESVSEVLVLARKEERLRDEIYIQVMKQLNENLDEESRRLGWILLHRLISVVKPSEDVEPYVRAFIRSEKQSQMVPTLDAALNNPGLAEKLMIRSDQHFENLQQETNDIRRRLKILQKQKRGEGKEKSRTVVRVVPLSDLSVVQKLSIICGTLALMIFSLVLRDMLL